MTIIIQITQANCTLTDLADFAEDAQATVRGFKNNLVELELDLDLDGEYLTHYGDYQEWAEQQAEEHVKLIQAKEHVAQLKVLLNQAEEAEMAAAARERETRLSGY